MSKTPSIHIQWIPAHNGITGNTIADLEASAVHGLNRPGYDKGTDMEDGTQGVLR